MKVGKFFKVSAAVIALGFCVFLASVVYMKCSQSSTLREQSIAVEQFRAKENLYRELIDGWTEIAPAKCGNPTPTGGIVTFESIRREHDGGFSLATNSTSYSKVSIDELARRLDTKPEVVRSVIDTLGLVGSSEIIQSGAEVKIISPGNDTHGYLHIDQSCLDAATIAFWSEQPGNFTADHPGRYIGLEALGAGWYYYIEQR
jgi:hypothetical protein